MSLFNNARQSVAKKGLLGSVNDKISGALGKASAGITAALGGGPVAAMAAGIGESMVGNAISGAIDKNLSGSARAALGIVDDLAAGDWVGAGFRALDAGLLDSLIPGAGAAGSQMRYWAKPNPLFGGITPKEAKRIYGESRAEAKAKKNLWLLEVTTPAGEVTKFNLFATEVEYAPHNIAGDKRRVGAAVVDAVTGGEAVELRITTMDDQRGTLRRWFATQAALVEHPDGTVGVPADFQIGIRILHGILTRSQKVVYEDKGKFRPVGVEYTLSRREDALQELQMTFTQLDTFMR